MPSTSVDAATMDATTPDNPLSRIQREINEVTERENEFRRTHSTTSTRKMSESDLELEHVATNGHRAAAAENGHQDKHNGHNPKAMVRAFSTSHLTYAPPAIKPTPPIVANGGNAPTTTMMRRYVPNTTQKGIMQRFIASRGQLNLQTMAATANPSAQLLQQQHQIHTAPIMATPRHQPAFFAAAAAPTPIAKSPDGRPIRKGFVPVEEKIQRELKDLKDREQELRKLRRQKCGYQLDLSMMGDSDADADEDYESDELDAAASPEPGGGKLRPAKSIGELYESLGGDSATSPSPPNAGSAGSDGYGSLKPAKSLAELCELGPDERDLAPSSTKLIAKWESLIQQKQESGAA